MRVRTKAIQSPPPVPWSISSASLSGARPPFTNALQPNYCRLTHGGETEPRPPPPLDRATFGARRSTGTGAEPFSTIARAEAVPSHHDRDAGSRSRARRRPAGLREDPVLAGRDQRLVRERADRQDLSDPLLRAGDPPPAGRRAVLRRRGERDQPGDARPDAPRPEQHRPAEQPRQEEGRPDLRHQPRRRATEGLPLEPDRQDRPLERRLGPAAAPRPRRDRPAPARGGRRQLRGAPHPGPPCDARTGARRGPARPPLAPSGVLTSLPGPRLKEGAHG